MSGRSEALAAAVRDAAAGWLRELEQLTPQQWRTTGVNAPEFTMGEDENRPIGVIVHHIAFGLALHAEMTGQLARGEPVYMTTLDIEGLASLNATHAAANPDPEQGATLAYLREGATRLAEVVAGLTDEELDRHGEVYGANRTTEGFVQRIGIGHGDWHLSSIRATIASG